MSGINTNRTCTDPFKFPLQEEKFNSIKRLSNLNMNGEINKILSQTKDKTNKERDSKSLYGGEMQILESKELNSLNGSIVSHSSYLDHNNDYIKLLLEKYKNEINVLKSYINRLNKEIRKGMNIEVPLLGTETEIENKNFTSKNLESLFKYFEESINRLMNPEYLNPILSIYDNHIVNLENEIRHYKSLCSKYESTISELTKENKIIREEILLKNSEIKELLKTKIQSDPQGNGTALFPIDMDFIKSLEERNNLLSKENEILALNYQKVSKELFDFSYNYSEKHREFVEKITIYDTLLEEFKKLNSALDSSMLKNQISETKIYELSDSIAKIEIEKENIRLECEKFRTENQSMQEANNFYKNYIQKLNM
jgi:chromosome segregation ATPase